MFETKVTGGFLGDFEINENGDPSLASGAVVGFTIYRGEDELEPETVLSPQDEKLSMLRGARNPNSLTTRGRASALPRLSPGQRLPMTRQTGKEQRLGTEPGGSRPDRALRSSGSSSSAVIVARPAAAT